MDINKEKQDKPTEAEVYKEFNSLFDQVTGSVNSLDPNLIAGKKKLISCRHEIIFNINARVVEEDETGNPVAIRSIATKNYHIPVPSDKDYDVFMNTFFEFLESCLADSTKYSMSTNKESTNG